MVIAIASLIGSRALKRSSQIRCTLLTISSGSLSEKRERVTYILEMLKVNYCPIQRAKKMYKTRNSLESLLVETVGLVQIIESLFLEDYFYPM